MTALLALTMALLVDAGDQTRGRVAELRGRLGLPQEVKRTGTVARLLWVERQYGSHIAEWTRDQILRAGYFTATDEVQRIDPLIPWLAAFGKNALDEGGAGTSFEHLVIRVPSTGLNLIVDWFHGAHPDLSQYPEFVEAFYRAQDWHENIAVEGIEVSQGEVVHRWPDGWTVQWLTLAQTREEGRSMGNCLARGAYDEGITGDTLRIYSLRTPEGRPVVSMAMKTLYVTEWLLEAKGRQNRPPIERYRAKVLEFVKKRAWGRPLFEPLGALRPSEDLYWLIKPDSPEYEEAIEGLVSDPQAFLVWITDIGEYELSYPFLDDPDALKRLRSEALKNPATAYSWALNIDGEARKDTRIAASKDPGTAYEYAMYIDERPHPVTRSGASKKPDTAFMYALSIDRSPHAQTWEGVQGDPYQEKYAEWMRFHGLKVPKE